nr:MAG TPA: membrane-spanning protein [Bacteriophage sp.]
MAASFYLRAYTRTPSKRFASPNVLQRLCGYQSVQRCWG